MTSHHLTAAANHYRSRRYDKAASTFDACEIRPSEVNDIFSCLPNLAIQADAALCRFRSSSSPQNESKYSLNEKVEFLNRARKAYRIYFSALEDVVCQLNSKETSAGVHGNEDLIDENRVQTAMAVLMTLVSIFWLELSMLPGETEKTNLARALSMVRYGIQIGACCFLSLCPKVFMPTWIEGIAILERIKNRLKDLNWNEEESTRMQFALKSIHHVLSIVDLSNGVDGEPVWNDNDVHCTTLYFERQLIKLLSLCKYGDGNIEKHTNIIKIGEKIMTKCDNIRLRKICTMVLVSDMFRNGGNMTFDSAINTLKPFVCLSATAAHLMSSLYIKKNEYCIALEYLYKSLSATKSYSQEYLDILWNIASCFALLGEPRPVVELLLHWISIHDANCDEEPATINSVSLDMSERKASTDKGFVLWTLMYASELVGDVDTSKTVAHVLNND